MAEQRNAFILELTVRWKKVLQHEFISKRMFGFSLFMMWNYLFFFSKRSLLAVGESADFAATMIFNASSLAYVVISLICVSQWKPLTEMLIKHKEAILWVSGVVLALGSFIGCLGAKNPLGEFAGFSSGVLTGAGSATITLLWGSAYANSKGVTTVVEIPFAFFLASLIVPLSYFAPVLLCVAIVTALPLLSAALLPLDSLNNALHEDDLNTKTQSPTLLGNPKRLLAKISCVSIIFGLCNTLMPAMLNLNNTSALYSLIMPLATLFAFAVFFSLVLFSRHYGFAFAYKPALFLMVAGYLLTIPLEGTLFVSVFSVASYTCFNVLNFLLIIETCQKFQVSPIAAFGCGRSALVAGAILGDAFNNLLILLFPHVVIPFALEAASCVLLLLLGYLAILTERDVDSFSMKPLIDSQLSEKELRLLAHYRNIIEACNLLSTRYNLGDRSRDVLICLAQGRTASDIEDELYMARGTVNTHMNRIYRKLGIHKRKELLDLIHTTARESN